VQQSQFIVEQMTERSSKWKTSIGPNRIF
jgi:hypothetical protein